MTTTLTKLYQLTRYPVTETLDDGTAVTIRPMVPTDEAALLRFFRGLPEAERFYLRDDVAFPEVVHHWAETLDYDRALPLLALAGDEIIADATLHRHRPGARKHLAEARLVVAPAYAGRGLGAKLLRELQAIANDAGMSLMVVELVDSQQAELQSAVRATGFTEVARLPGHAVDHTRHPRDLVVFECPLGKWLEWSQR